MRIKIQSEVFINYLWRILQIFGREGVIFIILFVSAKILTPYDFGVFNYLMAFIAFVIIFSDFGLSISTTKYIAQHKDDKDIKGVVYSIGVLIFIIFLLIAICLVVFGRQFLHEKYLLLLLALPIIFFAPLASVYDGAYRACGKFKELSLISFLSGLLSWCISFVLISNFKLVGAVLTQVLFYILVCGALAFFYRKNFTFQFNLEVIRKICSYGVVLGLVSLTYFFFTRINTLILGHFNKIIEVGYYEMLNKTILIILTFFTIFAQVISPGITREFYGIDRKNLIKKYKEYVLLGFIVGVLLVVAINVVFPILLKYYLPKYYLPVVIDSLRVLSLGLLTQGAGIIASSGFSISTGHGALNLRLLYFLAPLNLLLSSVALLYFGFIGMLISVVIVQLAADIFFIFYFGYILRRKLIANIY